MKNRKKIIRNVALLIAAVFCLLLLASTALFNTKKQTCDTLADVWIDLYHLISQKDTDHLTLGENWSDVKIYLSSHLYDGALREWRLLDDKGFIPENCSDKQIYRFSHPTPIESNTNVAANKEVFPVALSFLSDSTEFYNNTADLDYTRTVETVVVIGQTLYVQKNESLLWDGYTSQVIVESHIIPANQPDTHNKIQFQGDFFNQYIRMESSLPVASILYAPTATNPSLDYGTCKAPNPDFQ